MMRLVEVLLTLWVLFYVARGVQRWFAMLDAEVQRQRRRGRQYTREAQSAGAPRPPPAAAIPTPWQVLGVAQGANKDEIRAAYQKLMRQYHPDLVAHLGPELQEVAERRSKEISAALEALKRQGHLD